MVEEYKALLESIDQVEAELRHLETKLSRVRERLAKVFGARPEPDWKTTNARDQEWIARNL